jgi:N-acyl-D-amino-acid deacylase
MADFDLIISNGTVADGTGQPLREADVGITNGRIAAVGLIGGRGHEEINAKGKLVTPGFVDIHTLYDAQAVWDSHMTLSSQHGVTTAVMGTAAWASRRAGQRTVSG